MIGRITQQTIQRTSLANLQANLSVMSDLQGRMSGGKVITKPSDDPAGTAKTLQLRGDRRAAEQYGRNIDNGIGWLSTVDTSLDTAATSLRRARDLTVQGASSGSLSDTARDAIATELEGIRDSLLSQANTKYLGRSVYAGTSDADVAFTGATGTPPYTYQGVAGGTVERRIAPDTTVRVDADGAAVFGSGATSVFALLDTIASDLRNHVEVGARLTEIDAKMGNMLSARAAAGTRYGALEAAASDNKKALVDLKGQISAVEDIDLAEVIVELKTQEVAYQAALGATSRVLQPSLLDFLR